MGRAGKEISLPRGVTIRRLQSGQRLQIAFTWGQRNCRELLALEPTQANIKFAAALRTEILAKIVRGTFVYAEYFPKSPVARKASSASNISVGELLDQYLSDCEKAVAMGNMSPSTLDGYRKAVRAHLKPEFGDVAIKDLSPAIIRSFVKGLKLTAKSINNTMIPLRQMLDDAVNDDLIRENPMDRVALRRLVAKVAKQSTYVVDPFDADEVRAIIHAAIGQARNFIQFAFATGLRTSELIALRWRDVDLARRIVQVQVAVVEKVEKGTKTRAGTRTVELSAEAVQALESQRQWTQLQGERVFHAPHTGRAIIDDQQVRKYIWHPAIKASGVRYRNPYQTRHTFASTHLSRGANPWWVADQMGHEGVEMIYKTYGRWIPQNRTAIARAGM